MVKAIVLTDTHLNQNNIDQNKDVYIQAINLAKKHNLNKVLHAGDIFDARKGQTDSLLKTFEEILDLFHENGITLVAIPGNHDKSDYKSDVSYLDPYKHHPGFNLLRSGGFAEDNIYMFPYFLEDGTYESLLKQSIQRDFKNFGKDCILITHVAVNGVKNNDGSKIENNIKPALFSKFTKVLVGHYHNKSTVGTNIFYIGSAFQHNFGEDISKGFTLIMEDGTTQFAKATFKEYKKIVIEIEKVSPKEIEKMVETYANSEDSIRFVFKGTHEKLQAIDKTKFTKVGIDIKRESDEIEIGVEEAKNDEFISFDQTSIAKEFDEFCEQNNLDKKSGNKYLKQTLVSCVK